MIEVAEKLWVGSQDDYAALIARSTPQTPLDGIWNVVHACKEPHHRQALGYSGRGAPKDHPEYLVARRGNRMILNLVDVDDPGYIEISIIDQAVAFIRACRHHNENVLVHCNQGKSRSPTIAMLAIAPTLHADFLTAEEEFNQLYPPYMPAKGMRGFARAHWDEYHG